MQTAPNAADVAAKAPHQKLSVGEKVGYSLGDSSANFVFQTLLYFQLTYFVDILGVSTGAASILFLVGRLWDAVTDPVMGIIADRTKTRWGRFRPWLIWSALPFAIIFWLTFTAPGWESPQMKLVYAYGMYLLLMTVYTVNNVPYAALNGVMTADVNERTSLSTYRFVAVMITTFIVQGFTAPLADKFGEGDPARGWSITIGIYAAIAFVFFFVAFFAARERVTPDPEQKSSIRRDLADTFSNSAWLVLFCATLLVFIMLAFRGGSLYHFFSNNIEKNGMFDFLRSAGLAPEIVSSAWHRFLNLFGLIVRPDRGNVESVGFSLFNMSGSLITIIGVLLSKPLSERFGKKVVFTTSMLCTALATAWLMVIPSDNITMLFLQGLTWAACYGPSIPLLWSMIADAADFSEWKYYRRATGLVFAGVVFALKAGLGIGGFLGGLVLGIYGYQQGGGAQSESALLGIRLAASLYPAILLLGAAVIMLFYPINKRLNYEMAAALEARRRGEEEF